MELFEAITTGLLFAIGIFLVLRRNLIRSAIGLIVLSSSVILFLLAAGAVAGTQAPYLNGEPGTPSDALPQALILTAIVISMGALPSSFRCFTLFPHATDPATLMNYKD